MMILGAMVGCRASGGGGNGSGSGSGSGSGADASGGGATDIKTIRQNQPTNGTMVTLQNVIVTSHVSSKKYGHVYVQDAGGGQFSGIQLFCNYGGTHPDCAMTQAQIDALAIGTVVNVTGSFSTFLSSTAPAGAQPILEIDAPTITATGQTATPTAVDVDAGTIAHDQLMGGSDPYKGAYVHVTGATGLKASSIAATEFTMTCTDKSMPPQSGMTFGGFEATAGSTMLDVSLNFYNTVTYCLPCAGVAMPYPCTNPVTANETFSDLRGIVEPQYNSNGSIYLEISPTSDTDLPK
jgi:hypothetical protein